MAKYRCIKTCVVSPSTIYEPGDKIQETEYNELSLPQRQYFVKDTDDEEDDLQFMTEQPQDDTDSFFPHNSDEEPSSNTEFGGGDFGGGGSENSW